MLVPVLNVTLVPLISNTLFCVVVPLDTLPVEILLIASFNFKNNILPVSVVVKSPSVSAYIKSPALPGSAGLKSIIWFCGFTLN